MLINGSEKAETLTGGADTDTIYGYGGNDKITGNAGDDVLAGMAGADTLYGGEGEDYLLGGAGNDLLDGGNGADWAAYEDATSGVTVNLTLTGNQNTGGGGTDKLVSIENVYGSAFNDSLTGDAGSNNLAGDAGNDTLSGGLGEDNLFGGAGADSLLGGQGDDYLQGGAGNDTLDGGLGVDWAAYDDATAGVTVNLSLATAQNTGGGGVDKLVGIENLYGSAFNDVLTGDAGANILAGDAGNDTLNGGAGDDFLVGGAGADVIDGGEGRDTVSYESAASMVHVDLMLTQQANIGAIEQPDTLVSVECVTGSAFDDMLSGNASQNYLAGGAGDDALYAVGGGDYLDGGEGDDLLYSSKTGAGDILFGGAGNDVFFTQFEAGTVIGGTGDDSFYVLRSPNMVGITVVEGGEGSDTLELGGSYAPYTGVVANLDLVGAQDIGGGQFLDIRGVENIAGGVGNDLLTGDAGANKLWGSFGDDTLNGGDGADSLDGATGSDVLNGGNGDDWFYVGSLNEIDTVVGGAGSDTLDFSWSGLTVGVNFALASPATSQLGVAFSSIENVKGSAYADIIAGDTGDNRLYGLAGGDSLHGEAGDDRLEGGAGDDVLHGGYGADTLVGGLGRDVLMGDTGADVYRFEAGDSVPTGTGQIAFYQSADIILQFESLDRLSFDGPAGSAANYAEASVASWEAGMAQAVDYFAQTSGRYFAFYFDGTLHLFADTGAESTTFDTAVAVSGASLETFDHTFILGV